MFFISLSATKIVKLVKKRIKISKKHKATTQNRYVSSCKNPYFG